MLAGCFKHLLEDILKAILTLENYKRRKRFLGCTWTDKEYALPSFELFFE